MQDFFNYYFPLSYLIFYYCLLFIEEDKRKLFDKTLKKFKKSPKQIVKLLLILGIIINSKEYNRF